MKEVLHRVKAASVMHAPVSVKYARMYCSFEHRGWQKMAGSRKAGRRERDALRRVAAFSDRLARHSRLPLIIIQDPSLPHFRCPFSRDHHGKIDRISAMLTYSAFGRRPCEARLEGVDSAIVSRYPNASANICTDSQGRTVHSQQRGLA